MFFALLGALVALSLVLFNWKQSATVRPAVTMSAPPATVAAVKNLLIETHGDQGDFSEELLGPELYRIRGVLSAAQKAQGGSPVTNEELRAIVHRATAHWTAAMDARWDALPSPTVS